MDDQVVAIMVCLFRVTERIDHVAEPRPLRDHIANARSILAACRAEGGESKLASMTPEWCVRTFYEVNPGASSTMMGIPSLYLVDFARAVVRYMEEP